MSWSKIWIARSALAVFFTLGALLPNCLRRPPPVGGLSPLRLWRYGPSGLQDTGSISEKNASQQFCRDMPTLNVLSTLKYSLLKASYVLSNFHPRIATQRLNDKKNAILAGFCSWHVWSPDFVGTVLRSFAKQQRPNQNQFLLNLPICWLAGQWPIGSCTPPTKRTPCGCTRNLRCSIFHTHIFIYIDISNCFIYISFCLLFKTFGVMQKLPKHIKTQNWQDTITESRNLGCKTRKEEQNWFDVGCLDVGIEHWVLIFGIAITTTNHV